MVLCLLHCLLTPSDSCTRLRPAQHKHMRSQTVRNIAANTYCCRRPVKKRNGGVVAGIARTGGGRDSPIGYEDDNEDVRQNSSSPTFLATPQLSFSHTSPTSSSTLNHQLFALRPCFSYRLLASSAFDVIAFRVLKSMARWLILLFRLTM